MKQSLLNDDDKDHENNEYNEEYAEESPKEGVSRVVKTFLILSFIVVVILVLIPFLLPVVKSLHSSQQDVDNIIAIEDYQDRTIQLLSLKTGSNSEPMKKTLLNSEPVRKNGSNSEAFKKNGSNSEALKKTVSNSESFMTKYISKLCAIPWWAYAMVVVVFVAVCCIDLTRARSKGYTQLL